MKWVNVYLVGYVIFIIGIVAALAKSGVLEKVGDGLDGDRRRHRHRPGHHVLDLGQRPQGNDRDRSALTARPASNR